MKKLITFVAVAVCAASNASTWHEGWHGNGDSGDLPGTANVTTGTAGLSSISGRCGFGNDVDMYKIKVVNFAAFDITLIGGAGGVDTVLYLFDSTGLGVVNNDDAPGNESHLTNALVTANGDYYVAISRFNRRPTSATGAIWNTLGTGSAQVAPDGPGAADPVTGWVNATSAIVTYTMTLAGCDPSVIGADETATAIDQLVLDAETVVGGGAPTNGTVYVSNPAPAGGTTVNLSSSNPAAGSVPASVVIAEATTSATFAVTTSLVAANTTVTITGTVGADSRSDTLGVTSLAGFWVEDRPDYPAAANHGDAGTLVPTAQITSGSGVLNTIAGRFTASDIDLYCIDIVDFAAFTASCLNGGDTILFLFNSTGNGVVMNDDDPGGSGLGSVLTSAFVAANGKYYLAVCRYSGRPNGNATPDPIWIVGTPPFNVEKAPDGVGAALPLDNWTNLSTLTSTYTINLTGVEYCEKIIAPTSLVPGSGSILSGGVAQISASDNARVNMRPGAILVATAFPLVLQAVGTAPAAIASSLKVQIETRATVANVRQIVEARNFAAGPNVWDVLEDFTGLPSGANPDRAVTFTLTNPNNYIGPSNEIRVRIRCKNTTAVLVYPWQTQFDEVTWRFTP